MYKTSKYILFIGMGDWDIPQIEIAKGEGFKTVVTNRNPDALALKNADTSIIADGRDVYSILSNIYENKLENQIAYVYTGTELFTTAAVTAKTLEISWHSPYSAFVSEKKHLMRQMFSEAGILIPGGISSDSMREIEAAILAADMDSYVIKPSDSLSAQGVSVESNLQDLPGAFGHAIQYSASKKVICEEFIEGTLHDVNGILIDDGFYKLGINDKEAGPLPHAVVIKGSAPTSLEIKQQQELYEIFERACKAVGLGPGPVKGDFILGVNGEFYALEVAPRLHGPLGSLWIIPYSLGVNPMEQLLRYVSGKEIVEHDVGGSGFKSVVTEAAEGIDSYEEGKDNILAILEKPGIYDSSKWESNNDVPYYIVKREE